MADLVICKTRQLSLPGHEVRAPPTTRRLPPITSSSPAFHRAEHAVGALTHPQAQICWSLRLQLPSCISSIVEIDERRGREGYDRF